MFDVVAFLWLLEGVLSGFSGGLILELWLLLQWAVSLYASFSLGYMIAMYFPDVYLAYILGFLAIFALASLVFYFLMLTLRLVNLDHINHYMNSICGAILSLLKNFLLLYFIYFIMVIHSQSYAAFPADFKEGFVSIMLEKFHVFFYKLFPNVVDLVTQWTVRVS